MYHQNPNAIRTQPADKLVGHYTDVGFGQPLIIGVVGVADGARAGVACLGDLRETIASIPRVIDRLAVADLALKRVAIGRKNWLFAGHDEAGANHARLYTLIAGAERHGIDPQKYVTSLLAKIGQTKLSELGQFLPDNWRTAAEAEAATVTVVS